MKRIIYLLAIVIVVMSGCSKIARYDNELSEGYSRLNAVRIYVQNYGPATLIDSLDFGHVFVNRADSVVYVRVGFKGRPITSEFLIAKLGGEDNVIDANVVHLEKASLGGLAGGERAGGKKQFDGFISVRSLDGKSIFQSVVRAGFIVQRHLDLFENWGRGNTLKEASLPMPPDNGLLPEVVVFGYTSATSGNGISYADFLELQSLFEGWGGGGGSGGGGYSDGPAGSSGSSGSGYAYYGAADPQTTAIDGVLPASKEIDDKTILLGMDESYYSPAIDLNGWLKCFSQIPDDGSVCTLTIYGDLPVASDPTLGLNIWSGNTGHCFLQLQKINGGQTMTQVMGFTAQSAFKAIVNAYAYVPSKMVDNSAHTYNCSLSMKITPVQLAAGMDEMKTLSAMPYSVAHFDCLDYALAVVNTVRGFNPLTIDKTFEAPDPFSDIASGPKLYALLRAMVENGSPESSNILFGSTLRAGQSHGPCN